jgi:hypothetical protein
MNQMKNMERNQFSLRLPFVRQWKDVIGSNTRPQQEAKDLNTLNPIGMVNIEESPWCSPYQEAHQEK